MLPGAPLPSCAHTRTGRKSKVCSLGLVAKCDGHAGAAEAAAAAAAGGAGGEQRRQGQANPKQQEGERMPACRNAAVLRRPWGYE